MYSAFLFAFTITTMGYGKSAVLRRNTTNDVKIPESLLMKLRYVENASEFMSQFIAPRQPPAFRVFLAYLEDGRSETVSSDVKVNANNNDSTPPIAKNAGCIPEQHLIELPRPTDPAVIVWPMCTRVRRCSGCCSSKRLKCQPMVTSTTNVRTIAARYSKPASKTFDLLGYETVQLVQHDKCRCLCKETAEDCSSLQTYSQEDCRCLCRNAASSSECKGSNRHWSPTECACKCNKYDDCSTGFFFNPQVCRCESVRGPLRGISSSRELGVRPMYKDDGGENDGFRSQQIGIRPYDDDGPYSMNLQQNDRKRHRIASNDSNHD